MSKEIKKDEENIVEDNNLVEETSQEAIDEQEVEDVLSGNVDEADGSAADWFQEHKVKVIGVVLAVLGLVFATVIGMSQTAKELDLTALEWVHDDAKIEELKSTLIDGVSIESLYKETYVYNWSYAFSDGNEYLKVETEDSLDIYNTTDGELEESIDLLEMKKNFVGKQGLYSGEMAEIFVEIDEEYNVIAYLEIVEDALLEDAIDDDTIIANETEEITEELNIDEFDIEDEMSDIQVDDEKAMMLGKIVSITEVDFTLETGEIVKVEWDELGEVLFAYPEEGFLSTTLELRPTISEALTEKEYTYEISEDSEEENLNDLFDTEEEYKEELLETTLNLSYNGDYNVEIKSKKTKEIVFTVTLEGEEDVLVDSGTAYKQEDETAYIYKENGIEIYFEELETGAMLITGYDENKNMIIRIEE